MTSPWCCIIGICECRISWLTTMKTWLRKQFLCSPPDWNSIIDWDDVGAVPLRLSQISIAEPFVPPGSHYELYHEADNLFESHRVGKIIFSCLVTDVLAVERKPLFVWHPQAVLRLYHTATKPSNVSRSGSAPQSHQTYHGCHWLEGICWGEFLK